MTPSGSDHDIPIVVATKPITKQERRLALAAVIVLLTGTMIWAPFASVPLARIDAFIPVLQSVMCVADLITATLLLSQYAVQAQPAFLMLASGYLAAGLFAFLQTLTFPGGYGPNGLFGDGLETPPWLFVLWHTSFPLGVLLYALTKKAAVPTPEAGRRHAGSAIFSTVAGVVAAVAALTWVVAVGAVPLPTLYPSAVTRQTLSGQLLNAILSLWYATALVALIIRRRTLLDLWLVVTLCAWVPNFVVAIFNSSVRFSVGWYSARVYAFVASWTLLVVLLTETTLLYARLANALTLRQRERTDRLMTVDAATAAMAHEVGNPLGSIAMNAATALMQLEAQPPELKDMKVLLEEIEADTHRAGQVIASVRTMFNARTDRQTVVRLDDAGRQVLRFLRDDIQSNAIAVETDFPDGIPPVRADLTQLQQVLLNLVKNAVEAMTSIAGTRRLRLATSMSGNSVVFSVQDSGGGISSVDQDHIFDAFFTTKATGTGLGLSVCRTLMEKNQGALRLSKTDASGSLFEIAMPAA